MAESQKASVIRWELNAAGLRFGIVVSRFNSFNTDRLLAGALDELDHGSGAVREQIEIVRVPGSFEIPIAAKKLAATSMMTLPFDHLHSVAFYVVRQRIIDYVCSVETARVNPRLAQLDSGVPMAFCVLTCDTLEQAIDRAGLKGGNKGYEAGLGAVEMANLSRKLSKGNSVRVVRRRRR